MGKNIARVLREARIEAGLSQFDLAKGLMYETPQFISNIERGLAPIPTDKLIQVCRILGKRLQVFIDAFKEDYEDEMKEKLRKLRFK